MTIFHVARWHNSGRLFVSEAMSSEDKAEVDAMVKAANDKINDQSWPSAIRGKYFTYSSDMTKEDLDSHRPSERP